MTSDDKKYLLVGGGVGAAVALVGAWLFSRRPALAGRQLPQGRPHEGHHEKRQHGRGDHDDHQRGEYRRKKHRHKRHGHGG